MRMIRGIERSKVIFPEGPMEPERVFLHYPGQDNHKPQDVDDEFS